MSMELLSKIENHWKSITNSEAYINTVKSGKANGLMIGRLLAGTRYLIQHTPIHLSLALKEAQKLGVEYDWLRSYFEEHLQEEVGHDAWATQDLKNLSIQVETIDDSVSESMKSFVTYVENIIRKDVRLYPAYILWAEYAVVVGAEEFAKDLKEFCNIDASALSVFLKHAKLDQLHAAEGVEVLDKLVQLDFDLSEKFLHLIDETTSHYGLFFNDITEGA